MSEILVNTIKKADGTGGLTVPAETGTVVTTASPSLGRRNLIINGAMQVAQRGTSSTIDNHQFVVDRFSEVAIGIGITGAEITRSQESDAPSGTALKKSLKAMLTTAPTTAYGADDYVMIYHKLEHQDISPFLSSGSMTLSFWVKSSTTATYGLTLAAEDCNTTSGGAVYATTYTINSADTWEHKTITIPIQSYGYTNYTDNELGLVINWVLEGISGGTRSALTNNTWSDDTVSRKWTSSASDTGLFNTLNNYFQITGVQLEVGSVATPFEHRSYGEELALCQRYFQIGGYGCGRAYSDANAEIYYSFPLQMRATPTISMRGNGDDISLLTGRAHVSGVSNYNITGVTGNLTATGCSLNISTQAGLGGGSIVGVRGNPANFDAEL
jgi:hypothetical protein